MYSRFGGSKEKVSAVYYVSSCDYTQVEKSLARETTLK